MALQEYIALADIDNAHVKQFPPTQVQSVIDEANDYYESFGRSLGIAPADLAFPVSLISKNFLRYYVNHRLYETLVVSDGSDNVGQNFYAQQEEANYLKKEKEEKKLAAGVLTGKDDSTVSGRSIRTTRRLRTN